MSRQAEDEWNRRVGEVFSLSPRVAVAGGDPRWIRRKDEESALRSALAYPSTHVCVDGPSGSGKTSITKTVLARMAEGGFRYVYVKVNRSTSWNDFKSQVFENKRARKHVSGRNLKISLTSLLPAIEYSPQAGRGPIRGAADRAKLVAELGVHNLARILADEDLILVADDVNFASDELLTYLTDLCKTITDDAVGGRSKVVIIGTDDTFTRVIAANDSLRDRLDNVTVGSVPGRYDALRFIDNGLEMVGLRRLGLDKLISKKELSECHKAVFCAADGLPKSIVSLGRAIASEGYGRSRVSWRDVINVSNERTQRNFRGYRRRFRTLVRKIRGDDAIAQVCAWLYTHGPTSAHQVETMCEDLYASLPQGDVLTAVDELLGADFLVRTGKRGDRVFAKDPLGAHTLGIALREPARCGVEEQFFGFSSRNSQLLLRFGEEQDPTEEFDAWLRRFRESQS